MRTSMNPAILAITLLSAVAGMAIADTPQQELNKAVQEAVDECSNGDVGVTLNMESAVAIIAGNLDCVSGRTAAENAAMKLEYVKRVINLITVNKS